MKQSRDNYWSMVKGIAILAVLIIHIPLTSDTNSILASRQIVNFPVAVFVFLSGFFVKNDSDVRKNVKRLLFPYLIWSVFWCIITPPLSYKILIAKWLTGGFSILYFLFVLIQLKLLTPWLYRRITKDSYKWNKDIIWIITPLYLLLFSIIRLCYPSQFEAINNIIPFDNFFPAWLIYYYLGMLCKNKTIVIKPIYVICFLLMSLYISIVVAFWLSSNYDNNFPFTQSKLSSMCIALSVILFFFSTHDDNIPFNFIVRLGEMSFGIYLLHMPIKFFIEKIPFLSNIIQIPLLKYTLVLFLTITILNNVYKLFPKKIVRLFGLQ